MAQITVKLTDELGGSQTIPVNNNLSRNTTSFETQQAKTNKRKSELGVVGTMIGMRSLNYVTSNIGKWTGSQANQVRINNIQRLVGYSATAAANLGLGIAVMAMDATTTILDYKFNKYIEDKRSAQALARIGSMRGYRR